jgi:iron(III) transport system permease protein
MKSRITLASAIALAFCAVALGAFVLPVAVLVLRSLAADSGGLTLAHYAAYLATPGLARGLWNTALLGTSTVLLVVPLALVFSYALERSVIPGKQLLSAIGAVPLLIPSLLPALVLIYLFGKQGLLSFLLGGGTIYGFPGVLLADAVVTLPHAVIILRTALRTADSRLYEQATLLGAGSVRKFWTITMPAARYGLVSAVLVVFALTVTDIGAPLVVGGNFDVLSIVIYKQVLGQQNFELGAVAAIFLIVPSLFAIVFERAAAKRHAAAVSARVSSAARRHRWHSQLWFGRSHCGDACRLPGGRARSPVAVRPLLDHRALCTRPLRRRRLDGGSRFHHPGCGDRDLRYRVCLCGRLCQ